MTMIDFVQKNSTSSNNDKKANPCVNRTNVPAKI